MGKAEENKKLKRTALLSHAFSLFVNNGIANTSISDITNKAGVAKGTFYFYFKDKEDLIQKLVYQKGNQLLFNSLDELKKQGDLSVEDSIVFIADDLIRQLSGDVKLLKFIDKNLSVGIYKGAIGSANLHDIKAIDGLHNAQNINELHSIYKANGVNNDESSANSLDTDSLHNPKFDFLSSFYELIEKDGSKWNHPLLMLYTIVELVSSTCHTILLDGEPVDYETYKPYLFQCIRNIIAVFKVE